MAMQIVKKDRQDKFERAIAQKHAFDYFGMERGGHHAVVQWILACGPQPSGLIVQAAKRQIRLRGEKTDAQSRIQEQVVKRFTKYIGLDMHKEAISGRRARRGTALLGRDRESAGIGGCTTDARSLPRRQRAALSATRS